MGVEVVIEQHPHLHTESNKRESTLSGKRNKDAACSAPGCRS